jgi:hypothetical protein
MSVAATVNTTTQQVAVTVNPTTREVAVTVSNARGAAGSNSVTSATTSDGTADLDLLNVETVTATVSDTLTANHIHGNLAGNVYAHVRAGETLTKGDPVYVSGSHGSGSTLIPIVSKAAASNAAKMPAIGMMDADLANNATGHMVIVGTITELNTAGLTVNAELYVASAGGLTATPPTARAQPVARVERVNANNGAVIVKVNGLSASDATGNTLVRRTSGGDASFNLVFLDTIYATDVAADYVVADEYVQTNDLTVTNAATFNATTYTYGANAASAHRIALGAGTTGAALFGAADAAAARTTLGLATTNAPTFGGLDLLTATTTTLNVYNSLSGANFERLSFRWASNIARIGTAKGGTGTARDLVLETDGTERIRVSAAGNVGIGMNSTAGIKLDISGDSNTTDHAYIRLTRGANTRDVFVITKPFGTLSAANPQFSYGIASNTSFFSFQRFDGSTATADIAISTAGNVGIGTTSPTALLDVNSNTVRIRTARTPASAAAAGNAGDICWDADYIYVCTATNTWKRTAISTWP